MAKENVQSSLEAKLRRREAELERVQRIARMGGFEIDLRQGSFQNHRSPEYLRLHALPPEAADEPHDAWVKRLHPDDRERVDRAFKEAVAGSAVDYAAEYRIITAEGPRWISAVAEIERDAEGRAVRMVGAHIDITRTKSAESALRASEQRFRAAVEAVSGIVWTNDAEGRMVGEQAGWAGLTGQTEAEYQGYGWSDAVHPDDKEASLEAWQQTVAAKRTFDFEHRVRRHDGEWRLFSVRAVPVQGADGAIVEWVGVHTDITAEREIDDRLRRLNDTLETRVRAEIDARQDAQDQLAQARRLEALGQLAGGIAHDFNNVLQVIQGGVALISRRLDETSGVHSLVELIKEAAARGASITSRLLAFSRRDELRVEAIDPIRLLEGIHEILVHTLGTGIIVSTSVTPELPMILADRRQLETVLINLATNARDAMPQGGQLTISTRTEVIPRHGDFTGEPANTDCVRIDIQDDGLGMDAETLARASEPFFTTKPSGAGTGLGLAMARGFASQSGGAFAIDSKPGKGTTVSLWLPIARSDMAPAPPAIPVRSTGRARVLLTDDDPMVRSVLLGELEAAGFDVTAVPGADAALSQMAESKPFDILVSDLSMPGVNGLELIRAAQLSAPGLPAVLLTGYATDAASLAFSGEFAAPVSLLRKPITGAALVEQIAIVLEASRQVRAAPEELVHRRSP
jgi:PAS domain S-box-containing protein